MTSIWRNARRIVIHRVLHADDTPHQIALGVAIGVCVAFTPTIGFQTMIAVALAAAFKANKVVCIPCVWITNPITFWPIYLACFRLGNGVLGSDSNAEALAVVAQMKTLGRETVGAGLANLFELSLWKELAIGVTRAGAELWIGCLVVGLVIGGLAYGLSRWCVTLYRQRRQLHLRTRRLRRQRRHFAKHSPAHGTSA